MARWYEVERRYVTREYAYVQARTAAEAKAKVADGEFFDSEGDIEASPLRVVG